MIRRVSIIAALALLGGCAMLGPTDRSRAKYVAAHPELSAEMAQAIHDGRVVLGMSFDDVQASWGLPCATCYGTSNTPNGHVRVWNPIGYQYVSSNSYVYFDNNWRVVSWRTP